MSNNYSMDGPPVAIVAGTTPAVKVARQNNSNSITIPIPQAFSPGIAYFYPVRTGDGKPSDAEMLKGIQRTAGQEFTCSLKGDSCDIWVLASVGTLTTVGFESVGTV